MYPDRPLQACLHKGWTVYKKNTGRQMALCELFSSCCKGPRGSGVGNAGGQIPPPARRAGNAGGQIPHKSGCTARRASKSPPPQASGAAKHRHNTLQGISLAPPVEKPYEWRTTSTSKALQRIFSAPLSCKYHCTGNVISIIAPFCPNCLTISPPWK